MTCMPDLTDDHNHRHDYTVDMGSTNLSYERSPEQFTPQINFFEQEVIILYLDIVCTLVNCSLIYSLNDIKEQFERAKWKKLYKASSCCKGRTTYSYADLFINLTFFLSL